MQPNQLKALSLIVFTVQNAAFVLLMRLSKVMGTNYNSAIAVLVTEALKLPFSLLLLVFEKRSVVAAAQQLRHDIAGAPLDTLKIAIPALLYTVQNNALFVAVGSLEAAVFQVTYQLKTLTTALLTVIILKRALLAHQWFALFLLMGGTVCVQEMKASSSAPGASSALFIGVGATVIASVCSSVASVYLEKILSESKPSIWVRNTQLCLFTIPIALAGAMMVDDEVIRAGGSPLHGFNYAVWASILTNAAGGMIVAVVMKFAGNILRNFAQACAIILGGVGSWVLFDFQITTRFVLGVALVIFSIFIYGTSADQMAAWRNSLVGLRRPPAYDKLSDLSEEQAASLITNCSLRDSIGDMEAGGGTGTECVSVARAA